MSQAQEGHAPRTAEVDKDITKICYEVIVKAPVSRVYHALIDASQLQKWAAEHAYVDAKKGGEYRLWGKHTYGTPTRDESHGFITALQGPNMLEIGIRFSFGDAILFWQLSEATAGTRVQLESRLPGNTIEHSHFINADFVELSLYNLRNYIESGVAATLPEFTGAKDVMTVDVKITATPNDVFSALIDPKKMNQWIATEAVVEPQTGGKYSYGWKETADGKEIPVGATQIVEIVPSERLVHSWEYSNEPPTQVSWVIQGSSGTTTLTLTHSGFGDYDKIDGYVQGWAAFLAKLKAFLEGKSFVSRPVGA